jgi:hypothetical protein
VELNERKAFDTIVGEMFAAIDKPLGDVKTEAFWKGLQRLSILDMARIRDELLVTLETTEPPKTFSVSDIWALKRKLRARAPVPSNAPNGLHGEAAVDAHIARLTANDKPERAGEFASMIRRVVRNCEDRRQKDPEQWAKDVRIGKLDRIIATEAPDSPIYARALCEWREARGLHVGDKEWAQAGR